MLYGIVDLGYVERKDALEVGKALLRGGVSYLQLRAKGQPAESLFELGKELQEAAEEAGVPFVVNDHLELALKLRANGLHLGQEDGSLSQARARLPEGTILGRSTHSPDQARAALAEGADYIGFGPLFPTPTKLGRPGIGLEDVARVQEEVGLQIPVFCIGGIKRANLAEVLAAGARNVVVVSELLQAGDVEKATAEFVGALAEG